MVHKLRSRDLTYEWETDYYPWLYALPAMIERMIVIDLFFILFASYMNLKIYFFIADKTLANEQQGIR